MPTIKERLENNIVFVVLGTAVAAFGAGWGGHATMMGTPLLEGSIQNIDWQATAKEKGWIDKATCPAMPIALRLLSPGDNTTIEVSNGDLRSDLVISSSQPLPSADSVGFIINAEGDSNFYVHFPYFDVNEERTVYRDEHFVKIAKGIEKPTHVDMWAIVIDDKRKVGSVYGSLDQIRAVSNTIFLSDKIGIKVVPSK